MIKTNNMTILNKTNSIFNSFKSNNMIKFLSIRSILFLALSLHSCSDDDTPPEQINEEEVITTLVVTLTADSGQAIELRSQDLDGEGPNEPEITVSDNLAANTMYVGSIQVLNQTVDPAEPIHEEISEESDEHQFFYTQGGNLDLNTAYLDFDSNDHPLGLAFSLTTNTAGQGTMTVTLRHEPLKPNDGTLSGAGGETDISVVFPITVE
jgi:hypothetical protein